MLLYNPYIIGYLFISSVLSLSASHHAHYGLNIVNIYFLFIIFLFPSVHVFCSIFLLIFCIVMIIIIYFTYNKYLIITLSCYNTQGAVLHTLHWIIFWLLQSLWGRSCYFLHIWRNVAFPALWYTKVQISWAQNSFELFRISQWGHNLRSM